MPTDTLVTLFDGATKVTSAYGLGAFAIVGVLAIVYLLLTKRVRALSGALSLTPMWVVLFFSIAIPVAGEVIIKLNPDLPYVVRVFAVDKDKGLVNDVHVVSTAGGEPSKIDGGTQFKFLRLPCPTTTRLRFSSAAPTMGKRT